MLIGYKRGQGSIVLRVKILNSSVATGAGLTGLTSSSTGLIISTIADNESTATAYTVAASNIETITTLGTYAAPTSGKCRFKEVDSTNHKGVYEIQIADARFSVSNAKSLLVSLSGATNAAETDVVIPLRDLDPFDAVRAGLTALPNVASGSAGAIITSGTGTAQLSVSSGVASANTTQLAGQTVTAAAGVTFPTTVSSLTAGGVRTELATELGRIDATISSRMATYTQPTGFLTATFPTTVASTTNITAATGITLAAVTHTGAVIPHVTLTDTCTTNTDMRGTDGAATAAVWTSTKADYLDAAVSSRLASASYTTPPTAGENADAVWDEVMSGHTGSTTYGGQIVRAANSNNTVQITGSEHIAADMHESQVGVIHATTFDSGAIDAAALATDAVTEIAGGVLSSTVESTETLLGSVRLMRAALVGKLAGAATTTVTIRDAADSKARITATVDSDGNRLAVTTDAT